MNLPNPPFVKKFDFRGVYNQDITDQDAYYLAKAFARIYPLKKVLIGWDTRESSKRLAMNFISALKDTDIEISYLDKVSIDYVTVSAAAFDFDLSIMCTASHNPWDWAGLLIHLHKGRSLQGSAVEEVVAAYHEQKQLPYTEPVVNLAEYADFQPEIERLLQEKIQSIIPLNEIKPLKIVVDIGDGSGSKGLRLLERLIPHVSITHLNDRGVYDANSPHVADPAEIKNMQQLIEKVKEGGFDAGFAFDSDADRALAVDEKGNYLNGSLLASALVQTAVMLEMSAKKIGYAVEMGPSLYNTITELNVLSNDKIEAAPIPVGRSIVRTMVQDGAIDMGIENVGHFYFKDFFMTDSGMFVIALILYWMSMNGKLSQLLHKNPDGLRGHGSFPLNEGEQSSIEELTQSINTHFEGKKIKKIEVDGVRYEIYRGNYIESWYAMRKSGYEPIEKYYFGSFIPEDYEYLQTKFADMKK